MRHFPNSFTHLRRGDDLPGRTAGPQVDIGLETRLNRGVCLSHHDFSHHLLIAGGTGVGKSMLLEQICRRIVTHRSLSAQNGGLVLFDPHWSIAPGLLNFMAMTCIDVPLVVIEPDGDDLVAFDPIWNIDENRIDRFGNWIAHIWQRTGNSDAPRLSSGIVQVATALSRSGAAFSEAYDLLHPIGGDPEIRSAILDRLNDPILHTRWAAHLKSSDSYFELNLGSTERALSPLIDSPVKRLICGLGASFQFSDALKNAWIVLIGAGRSMGNLTHATLMLDALWDAVVDRSPGQPPMHLVIDEFPELLSPAAIPLLPQARKFRLSVTLATQSPTDLSAMGPIGRQMLNGILHSTRSKITFQLDGDGARVLAGQLQVQPDQITQLPRRNAIVRTMTDPTPRRFITDDVPSFSVSQKMVDEYVRRLMNRFRGDFVFSRDEASQRYQARRKKLIGEPPIDVVEPDDFAIFSKA